MAWEANYLVGDGEDQVAVMLVDGKAFTEKAYAADKPKPQFTIAERSSEHPRGSWLAADGSLFKGTVKAL